MLAWSWPWAAKPRSTDELGWCERAVATRCPAVLGDWDLRQAQSVPTRKGISGMQLSHTRAARSGGVRRSESGVGGRAGPGAGAGRLGRPCEPWPVSICSVPADKGANAGLKVASLVAGMVAGADSIDDMALLRHGGMGRVFTRAYAPSTLGSFLRAFTFGHVRQLDAVAARFLTGLAAQAPQVAGDGTAWSGAGRCRRHDHRGPRVRQAGRRVRLLRGPRPERAAGHGHHDGWSPVVVAQRLRKGSCGPRAGPNGWWSTRSAARRTYPRVHHEARCCAQTERSLGAPAVCAAVHGGQVSVNSRARHRSLGSRGVLRPAGMTREPRSRASCTGQPPMRSPAASSRR